MHTLPSFRVWPENSHGLIDSRASEGKAGVPAFMGKDPTNSALLAGFRLSSDAEILLLL